MPRPDSPLSIHYDEPVCAGSTLHLSTSNQVPGVQFSWTGPNGFTLSEADTLIEKVSEKLSGLYKVTASIESCSSSAEAHINVYKPYIDYSTQVVCSDEGYRFNGRLLTEQGTYRDSFHTTNGCDSIVVLSLFVMPSPESEIKFSHDGPLCIGDTISLSADIRGATRYNWYKNDLNQEGSEYLSLILQFSNRIRLIAASDNGCSDTAALDIQGIVCCDAFIPNVFSPNNDGLNDYFGPVTDGFLHDYQMTIFNRWGQSLYITNKLNARWDGTISGAAADVGTYHYYITARCTDGTVLARKGTVMLVR